LTRDDVCGRHQRSALIIPTTRLAIGNRTFSVAAASTWNSLPFGLTSASSLFTFTHQLKMLLFARSYPDSFPTHMTNRFRPVPQIPSFRLTLLGVLAVILTLRHLNQLFDE